MNSHAATLAIFDVDHTLIKGDSLLWFGKFLLTRRRPIFTEIPKFVVLLLRHVLRAADAGDLKAAILKILASGMEFTEMTAVVDEFTESVLVPGMYRQAEDRIHWHHSQAHRVIFLSASPAMYLEGLAAKLGAEAVVATQLRWRDGVFLGDIEGGNCKGEEKLARLLAYYDGQEIDWQSSYYYADSSWDIPVFEKVGHPVMINPGFRLARFGTCRQWQFERWR